MRRFIPQILFVYLVCYQVVAIYVGPEFGMIRIWKFDVFQLALLPAILFAAVGSLSFLRKKHLDPNRFVLISILFYVAYQVLVIVPFGYFQSGLQLWEVYWLTIPRLYFLLVLFVYWFVLASFKKIQTPFNWIAYSSIVLWILVLYNYKNGIYDVTNTGQLRLVSGVAAMLFAFTLVTRFSLFSHERSNYLLTAIPLAGFVFVNHRSAYIMLGALLLLSVFVSVVTMKHTKLTSGRVVMALLTILLIVVAFSQVSFIKENFMGRIVSSFNEQDPNAQDRLMRWDLAYDYFLQHPVNGSGLKNQFYEANVFTQEESHPPHNFVLEVLATQGLVGFLWICLIFGSIIKVAYKNRNDNVSYQMSLVVIFYILYSLMNVTFFDQSCIFVLVFSSAVILYRNKQLRLERLTS